MKAPGLLLETLRLQNFATFRSHEINFSAGLNAIVGETGSGKSLILDALQLVFGGRADKRSVRSGAEMSVVEATLRTNDAEVTRTLEDLGFPSEDGEVIIKRTVKKDGTSKCWLNNMSCSLSQLVTVARRYIDLVGQFENQKLLSEAYQLKLLDQFAGLGPQAQVFREHLSRVKSLREEIAELERSSSEREQRLDYLQYQLDEIDGLGPVLGEEERLLEVKSNFQNLEKRQALQHQLTGAFDGTDDSSGILGLLRGVRGLVARNASLLPVALQDQLLTLEESAIECSTALGALNPKEMNEEELQTALDRLDGYQRLKRKFGGSIESMLAAREAFAAEIETLRSNEHSHADLSKTLKTHEAKLLQLAESLHAERVRAAKKFSDALTACVRELKMTGALISLELQRADQITDAGLTRLAFLAQTNPGEGFFRVKEIASGGELSRILLALRQVLATHDSISIFLFDEIDTGMGGETALHIGKSLKKVSQNSQVVTITHLPQIASFADRLIVVSKETTPGDTTDRTESRVKHLSTVAEVKREIELMTPLH